MNTPVSAMTKAFAAMILDAMRIRENSFDKVAADLATADCDARKEAEPEHSSYLSVDYNTFYRKTQQQAAYEAAVNGGEPMFGSVIYLLMANSWNDISMWAEKPYEENPDELTMCLLASPDAINFGVIVDYDDGDEADEEVQSTFDSKPKKAKPSPMENVDERDSRASNRAILAHHDAHSNKK